MKKNNSINDIVSSYLCDRICEGVCLGNEANDRCFCTEAGLAIEELLKGMISAGYMRMMPKP